MQPAGRWGLGVALQEPRYVVDIDAPTSTIVIGDRDDLLVKGCIVRDMSFVTGRPPVETAIQVKVRYRSRPVAAQMVAVDSGWQVDFDDPQAAVAPGQAAVLYHRDLVIGGGTISSALR